MGTIGDVAEEGGMAGAKGTGLSGKGFAGAIGIDVEGEGVGCA
jgi:hypothetical protein